MDFTIDKQGGTPLYRQIAAQLRSAIESGEYHEGDRLPTEAELFAQIGVSKGTIKAAYAELQQAGYIRKVQGSGAYVQRPTGEQLKREAQELARQFFDEISLLRGITPTKAYLLFREELAKEFAASRHVSAALVDCTGEVLSSTMQQLAAVEHLSVTPYLLDDILSRRTAISADCDFVLTTQAHYSDLIKFVAPLGLRMEQMGLSVSRETVAAMTKVPEEKPIGVIYRSAHLLENIVYTMENLLDKHNRLISGQEGRLEEAFAGVEVEGMPFVVPPDYEKNSGPQALRLIERVRRSGGQIIPFQYLIDQGSLMHLEQKVKTFYAEKDGGAWK